MVSGIGGMAALSGGIGGIVAALWRHGGIGGMAGGIGGIVAALLAAWRHCWRHCGGIGGIADLQLPRSPLVSVLPLCAGDEGCTICSRAWCRKDAQGKVIGCCKLILAETRQSTMAAWLAALLAALWRHCGGIGGMVSGIGGMVGGIGGIVGGIQCLQRHCWRHGGMAALLAALWRHWRHGGGIVGGIVAAWRHWRHWRHCGGIVNLDSGLPSKLQLCVQ